MQRRQLKVWPLVGYIAVGVLFVGGTVLLFTAEGGPCDPEGRRQLARAKVRAALGPAHSDLELRAEERVEHAGHKVWSGPYRWFVIKQEVCVMDNKTKTLTPKAPYCTRYVLQDKSLW